MARVELLRGLIDYAGLFPPAALSMQAAVQNYGRYRQEAHAWMLGRFVVPSARREEFYQCGGQIDWPVAILDGGCERHGEVVYREIPVESSVEKIAALGARAKVRTGGVMPVQFPSPEALAGFIRNCAVAGVPFKATAGLHHAVRGEYRLTYAPDSPSARMHGFLNVFLAAALPPGPETAALLAEESPGAFIFGEDAVAWRGRRITREDIAAMRADLAISFGSCSFEEPVAELQSLGLL
ncbi:MAG: hypothetical protein HYR60_01975 [Acidobacteria bacterium]|nr:hypothetical protein [Acidobacteriota bacterium]MBI3471350.1 hypothetical protein [Candidatus Solibacter usitatus]